MSGSPYEVNGVGKLGDGGEFETSAHATNLLSIGHEVHLMPFSHPYVCKVREILYRYGVRGIREYALDDPGLNGPLQEQHEDYLPALSPNGHYVANTELLDEFEFRFGGAYSVYNWELFFHTPMLIAIWLSKSDRHEEAQEWMHAVFNPLDVGDDDPLTEAWRFKPFREVQTEAELVQDVNQPSPSTALGKWLLKALGGDVAEIDTTIEQQIDEWERDPFNPHLIAQMRPIAYMKWTVRVYIENLIAWGDKLFRQDTAESIVEAQQLYMLAARILGQRPQLIDSPDAPVEGKSFHDLEDAAYDDLSNPLVEIESVLPVVQPNEDGPGPNALGDWIPYFGIPANDQLLGLWDTVEDRLFKIRHCLNIEGIARELPLFEPPIDPALLVRARAAGLDIASVLSDLHAPPPLHRFAFLYQRALDFASFVTQLGSQLLASLEKQDAESLAVLRSTHEVTLLEQVRTTRQQQLREAEEARAVIARSRAMVEERHQHYQALLETSPSPGIIGVAIERELTAAKETREASQEQKLASNFQATANHMFTIPQFSLGVSAGAFSATTLGGQQIGNVFTALSGITSARATSKRDKASMAATAASYDRRAEEWKLQLALAEAELRQIDQQLVAADIRVEVARAELASHDKQIEQAREVRDFFEDKYTREELYGWMVRELQTTYHRAYKLAFDMARRAERAYQFERLEPETRFIEFGQWDGVRKGLLAGEKLLLDLRRMEASYLEKDRREFEITKHVSLAEHNPQALLALRETGVATIQLSEALFDLDYPGHYHRRIKNVSLTLPSVAGAYSSVSCTLTLLSNKVRTDSKVGGGYVENPPEADSRFRYRVGAVSSIATSQATGDTGMFELSFSGDRLLPFEGAGAISTWRIELPRATNRFDPRSLSDAILQIQYTARDGGGPLRQAALASVMEAEAGPAIPRAERLVSARTDLAAAWEAFETELVDGKQVLTFSLDGMTPYIPGRGATRIVAVRAAFVIDHASASTIVVNAELSPTGNPSSIGLHDASVAMARAELDVGASQSFTLTIDPEDDDLEPYAEEHPTVPERKRLAPSIFPDLLLVFELERDPPLA